MGTVASYTMMKALVAAVPRKNRKKGEKARVDAKAFYGSHTSF
jgi:hypothetical protein